MSKSEVSRRVEELELETGIQKKYCVVVRDNVLNTIHVDGKEITEEELEQLKANLDKNVELLMVEISVRRPQHEGKT